MHYVHQDKRQAKFFSELDGAVDDLSVIHVGGCAFDVPARRCILCGEVTARGYEADHLSCLAPAAGGILMLAEALVTK